MIPHLFTSNHKKIQLGIIIIVIGCLNGCTSFKDTLHSYSTIALISNRIEYKLYPYQPKSRQTNTKMIFSEDSPSNTEHIHVFFKQHNLKLLSLLQQYPSLQIKTPNQLPQTKTYKDIQQPSTIYYTPPPFQSILLNTSALKTLCTEWNVDAILALTYTFYIDSSQENFWRDEKNTLKRQKLSSYYWKDYIYKNTPSTLKLNIAALIVEKNGTSHQFSIDIEETTSSMNANLSDISNLDYTTSELIQSVSNKFLTDLQTTLHIPETP